MEITKEILAKNGIDPSLYSKSDMAKIGEAAEKIKELGLEGAVAAVPLNSPEEESLRNRATEYIQGFNGLLENMKTHLDSIAALCSVKTSIFSGGISETERKTILDGAGDLISRINRLGEKGLDLVGEMFRTNERLQEIQSLYNNSLYSLGLLNVGAGVLGIEAEGIYDVIETAFDKFNDTTAFVNDLNDRTIIFEEAIELKLNPLLSELLDDIDYDNDGAALSTQKIINTVSATKIMLTDVIER